MINETKTSLTKLQALNNIKLLSALESWSLSCGSRMPEYLWEQLQDNVDLMQKIVLGESHAQQESNGL